MPMSSSWRRSASALLLASVWLRMHAAEPAPAEPPAPLAGTGRLEGRVLESDGKTPVPNAVVRACYLEGERVLASAPSGPRGQYRLESLPPGYADLVVETSEGVFVANQVLQLRPDARVLVDFVLAKFSERPVSWNDQKKRATPCGAASPVGAAEVGSKGAGGFVRSPKGIALIAGLGGAALLLAASGGGGNESPASAFVP